QDTIGELPHETKPSPAAVAVCGNRTRVIQTTRSPPRTVSVFGLKRSPSIVTVWAFAPGFWVALGAPAPTVSVPAHTTMQGRAMPQVCDRQASSFIHYILPRELWICLALSR